MSSTFSQASEVSVSDSKELGCEPSRSVRSIASAGASSPITGLISQSIPTCEPSQRSALLPMELPSMSSPAASPAKMYRKRGVAPASTVGVADYGESLPDLSEKSDPIGSSLRTSLISELSAQTGYLMTWKRQTTPRGRSWWVLGTPALPTGETVSGLSQTPRRCSGLRSRGINQTELTRWLLPTPTRSIGSQGPRTGDRPRQEGKSLRDLARGQIGTAALLTLVEWMMGYRRDWLRVLWAPSETLFSRNSQKSSVGRS
jgi:hypothetical protein